MVAVHLRSITQDNWRACLRLQISASQMGLVATNAQSLAEAKVNPQLVPLAVYDGVARSSARHAVPMVGFILRLMIEQAHQRRGYGRAAMAEVMRRPRLYPEVEMIATSHRQENAVAASSIAALDLSPGKSCGPGRRPQKSFSA